MKQNKKKAILIIAGIFIAAAVAFIGICLYYALPFITYKQVTEKQLESLNIGSCNKLMIVAHPDDELLWGGGHLMDGGYLVVCITNGYNETRSREFNTVMKATGNKGIILSYPDKIGPVRSKWLFCKDNITEDLDTILNYKSWELVATHNAEGEYGHQHHIMTHKLVTDVFMNMTQNSKLYYFGTYYTKSNIPEGLTKLDESILNKKEDAIKLYESQKNTCEKFVHMNPYENWIQADIEKE